MAVHALFGLYRNRWVRYLLTGLLLALVVWRVQPQRVTSALQSAHPQDFLLALVLTVPFLYLKALRWYLMLRGAGVRASFGEAFRSLIGGMGLALLTPARLGEVVRGAYIHDRQKMKIGGLVLLDKGFDVLVLAGLSIAGAWALVGPLPGILLAAVTVLGCLVVYRPERVRTWLLRLTRRQTFLRRLDDAVASLECLSPRLTTAFLLVTGASFAVVLAQFGIVLLSWRAWSPDVVLLTFPLVILSNVLPITVGGLGVREGLAVLLLGHYGVSPAHAALAAFLMFFINTALPGILGALVPPVATLAPTTPARSLDHP